MTLLLPLLLLLIVYLVVFVAYLKGGCAEMNWYLINSFALIKLLTTPSEPTAPNINLIVVALPPAPLRAFQTYTQIFAMYIYICVCMWYIYISTSPSMLHVCWPNEVYRRGKNVPEINHSPSCHYRDAQQSASIVVFSIFFFLANISATGNQIEINVCGSVVRRYLLIWLDSDEGALVGIRPRTW